MKTVGIIPNIDKDRELKFTDSAVDWLLARGAEVLLPEKVGKLTRHSGCAVATRELYSRADFLVALGGDGTILRVSHKSALYDKPVLGINLGTLGYLTDVERDGIFGALEKVLAGNYYIEKRIMLNARPLFRLRESKQGEAPETAVLIGLNDISVSRGVFSKLISFELRVNGEYIDNYRADGIIVATPTGSTAYNLSAGGPILKPDSDMMAITPICPHMMHSRPYVVPAGDVVTVKITGSSDDVIMAIDGDVKTTMRNGDEVEITRSEYQTKVIKTKALGFYDVLRRKLGEKSEDRQ